MTSGVLGEILGQVISESGGQDLLADVEDLRHRVIAARRLERRTGAAARHADEDIAAALWPAGRCRAPRPWRVPSLVYFHLANLAEEHQRIRTLRERDTGAEPVRESLAAAMASLGRVARALARAASCSAASRCTRC